MKTKIYVKPPKKKVEDIVTMETILTETEYLALRDALYTVSLSHYGEDHPRSKNQDILHKLWRSMVANPVYGQVGR